MKERYELTLTQNYVSDWDFCDAVRELIQNGTDQEILDENNKFTIDYDRKTETLRLINKTSKLKINTLLLGKSSKSDNDDTVGQFGEGYKIAALVLNRLGKTFTIYNNEKNEVWTTRFSDSKKWLEKILIFEIEKIETEDTGLVIEVCNVESEEYYDLWNIWLGFVEYDKIETTYGEILIDEELKNKIFVNGLAIDCGEKMEYGYNFKPKYIDLERDRKTCDSWNAKNITSKMISEAMINGHIDFEKVNDLLERSSGDILNLGYYGGEQNTKEITENLIKQFDEKNKFPNSIPVSSQKEINIVNSYGGSPVVVPQKVASLLSNETQIRIKKLKEQQIVKGLTLKEEFQRWYDIYKSGLSDDCKNEIAELINRIE